MIPRDCQVILEEDFDEDGPWTKKFDIDILI